MQSTVTVPRMCRWEVAACIFRVQTSASTWKFFILLEINSFKDEEEDRGMIGDNQMNVLQPRISTENVCGVSTLSEKGLHLFFE